MEGSLDGAQVRGEAVSSLDRERLLTEAQTGTPLEQLRNLTVLVAECTELVKQASELRVELIQQLLDDDRSLRYISRNVGVSTQALSQMVKRKRGRGNGSPGPPPPAP